MLWRCMKTLSNWLCGSGTPSPPPDNPSQLVQPSQTKSSKTPSLTQETLKNPSRMDNGSTLDVNAGQNTSGDVVASTRHPGDTETSTAGGLLARLQPQIPPSSDFPAALIVSSIPPRTDTAPSSITISDAGSSALHPDTGRLYFIDTIWLGGEHDGYPLLSFNDYWKARRRDNMSHEQIAALSQCHLTFGLLEAVMEVKIPESALLSSSENGSKVLHSKHLPSLLQDWRDRIRECASGSKEDFQKWAQRVEQTLRHAYSLLMVEISQPRYSPLRLALLPEDQINAVLSAIAAIAEAVTVSRTAFGPTFIRGGLNWTFVEGALGFCRRRMLDSGWCPLAVSVTAESVCAVMYAMTQRPCIRDWLPDHHNCTSRSCVANNVDTTDYTNRHLTPSCACSYIFPPKEDVIQILSDGRIPVVIYDSEEQSLRARGTDQTPYVAISHVWSDGLGSTTEAGLPFCQVQRLAALSSRLVNSGAFWMDALCIPEQRDMRKRAIWLMKQTYKDAHVVLVLDTGIRSCSVSSPLQEKLLRVLSSAWMQRLWTLQEALLAKNLVFELSDGFVSLDDLIPKGEDLLDALLMGLAGEIFRLTKYQRYASKGPGGFWIGDVARSLQWRTTSKAEDETLAICGLLNVDAAELSDLAPGERMKTFLMRVQQLPRNAPFFSNSKLEAPCFRWAPASLMHGIGAPLAAGKYEAWCEENGLLAEYFAIYFPPTDVKDIQWHIHDASQQRTYRITDVSSDKPDMFRCNVLLLLDNPGSREMIVCIAAYSSDGDTDNNDQRAVCEFRRRLMLTADVSDGPSQNPSLEPLEAKSGRLRVRLV